MPYRFRRYRRSSTPWKRNYIRKTSWKRFKSKVVASLRTIAENKIVSEVLDTGVGSITGAPSIQAMMPSIAQGSGRDQRTGGRIKPKRITLTIRVTVGAPAGGTLNTTTNCRLLICHPRCDIPTFATYVNGVTPDTPWDGRFGNLFRDWRFTIGSNGVLSGTFPTNNTASNGIWAQRYFKFTSTKLKSILFTSGGDSLPDDLSMIPCYLVLISNAASTAVPYPRAFTGVRLSYIDV